MPRSPCRPVVPLLLLPLTLLAPAARADRTIAVMPFKNLSQARNAVGEAIRETVTTDLKGVPGVKVIERSFIDKVIAEQNLQAQRADLDPSSSVKVGKLLGAQLIVAGAYQEAGDKVRLTSRFVSVESGQIVGTAKVDGRGAEFLTLQDKITVELLKSAGIAGAQQQAVAKRTRPPVKSLKTLELYGDALLASDDSRRRDLLRLAVAQDPGFVYAAKDLEALEARLREIDRVAAGAQAREIKQLRDQLDAERDPGKKAQLLQTLLNNLTMGRKYKQLGALCRYILAAPDLPPAPSAYASFTDQAANSLIMVMTMYNDWDGILREGEKFCAAHPQSMYFASVRGQIDRALMEKHAIEDGVQGARDEIAGLSDAEKKDPCRLAPIYSRNKQWPALRKQLESMKPGQCITIADEFQWMQYGMAIGDFALARKAITDIKKRDPSLYTSLRAYESTLPE